MKKFDILYKRTKTGAIQYWKISLDHTNVSADNLPQIIKESGQLGTTSPITHVETIQEGKQKRSMDEQAEFMAESDWKKKKDEGYKSLADLGISFIVECVPNADAHTKKLSDDNVYRVIDNALPKFNSDANGNVKPMLATDWKKIKKIEYPCYIEPKLDGVRCLMIVNSNGLTFLSRNGKEYNTLNHIAMDVDNAVNAKRVNLPFILDGEIYSDEITFQEIVAASKKQSPNSLKLHFRAYDIVNNDTQMHRRNALKPVVEAIGSEFIQHITWFIATDPDDVKSLHDQFVQEGNEGAMLRLFEGKYGQGQRSRELLKVKEFDETEYALNAWEFGQRGVEDLIAVCRTEAGLEFRAKMQGSKKQKEELYNSSEPSKQLLLLTTKHFGLTTDGIPRFPIGKTIRDYE